MCPSLKHLLPALLLSTSFCAQADVPPSGDFWIVHQEQQASGYRHIYYIDDRAGNTASRPGGIRTAGVFQAESRQGGAAWIGFFDIEVDCAKKRARVTNIQVHDDWGNTWSGKDVQGEWLKKPEDWMIKSQDFVCKPDQRSANRAYHHLGKMPVSTLEAQSSAIFISQARQESKEAILKKIDEAFDMMPQPGTGGSMENVK
jgi:hypothetical protein